MIKVFTSLLRRLETKYNNNNIKIKKSEEIPDDWYLMKKAVLIFGISGAFQMDELLKMCIGNIEEKGPILIVTIPYSKTNIGRFLTGNIHYTIRHGLFVF